MEFPLRTPEHVMETESFKALDACIPSQWILRHVTERDYGIDCLVEIVADNGEMRGDLISIQLKAHKKVAWREAGQAPTRTAGFSRTKVTTINYWMGLPVPVFLAVYEQKTKQVYAVAVKRQVRQQHAKRKRQKFMSFELQEAFNLTTDIGLFLLRELYFREKAFPQFSAALLDLLFNDEEYADFFAEGIGADFFLDVDENQLTQLVRLYRSLRTVAEFTGIQWTAETLDAWITDDKKEFAEDWYGLHQFTLDRALRQLAPIFLQSLKKARAIVLDKQPDFWCDHDPLLVRYCERREAQMLIDRVSKELSYIIDSTDS